MRLRELVEQLCWAQVLVIVLAQELEPQSALGEEPQSAQGEEPQSAQELEQQSALDRG